MRYFTFLILCLLFSCQRGEVSTYTAYLNHTDTVKYVGKEQCRMCHAEIYDSYVSARACMRSVIANRGIKDFKR